VPHVPQRAIKERKALSASEKEERTRRLNVLNSRRKRGRRRAEVEVFREQVDQLSEDNRALRVEHGRLEGLVKAALDCAANHNRMAFSDEQATVGVPRVGATPELRQPYYQPPMPLIGQSTMRAAFGTSLDAPIILSNDNWASQQIIQYQMRDLHQRSNVQYGVAPSVGYEFQHLTPEQTASLSILRGTPAAQSDLSYLIQQQQKLGSTDESALRALMGAQAPPPAVGMNANANLPLYARISRAMFGYQQAEQPPLIGFGGSQGRGNEWQRR
jgi:hypothetical protein